MKENIRREGAKKSKPDAKNDRKERDINENLEN